MTVTTRAINWYWLLPVATGILGALAAYGLYQPRIMTPAAEPPSPVTTAATVMPARTVAPASAVQPQLLEVVTLPPPPAATTAVARQVPVLTPRAADEQLVIDHRRPANRQTSGQQQPDVDDLVASGEVSAELAARFNAAMTATDDYEKQAQREDAHNSPHPMQLTELPEWYQQLVPPLSFSSHIYSSDDDNRWVKVNGQVVREGELIDSNMRLVAIHPQEVVIEMQERRFTLPALTDW